MHSGLPVRLNSVENNNFATALNDHNDPHTHTHTACNYWPFHNLNCIEYLFQQNILGFHFIPKPTVSIWSLCCEMLKVVILSWRTKENSITVVSLLSCPSTCSVKVALNTLSCLFFVVFTCQVNQIITRAVEVFTWLYDKYDNVWSAINDYVHFS